MHSSVSLTIFIHLNFSQLTVCFIVLFSTIPTDILLLLWEWDCASSLLSNFFRSLWECQQTWCCRQYIWSSKEHLARYHIKDWSKINSHSTVMSLYKPHFEWCIQFWLILLNRSIEELGKRREIITESKDLLFEARLTYLGFLAQKKLLEEQHNRALWNYL